VEEFEDNDSVAFADVNLSEEPIRGTHFPGMDGWPTIKYFNKETGYEGRHYTKKTNDAMCTELGPSDNSKYMRLYVEEAGGVSRCASELPLSSDNCSEKEIKFYTKFAAKSDEDVEKQVVRLTKMSNGKMKADLKKWINQRIALLKLIRSSLSVKDEL